MASTKHSNLFMIKIYTDGACSGNPGIGGWGAVILENQNKIEVVKIESNNLEQSFKELETAHAFQVSAARDEVPKIFHVNEEFLSKTPNLILVSSGVLGMIL